MALREPNSGDANYSGGANGSFSPSALASRSFSTDPTHVESDNNNTLNALAASEVFADARPMEWPAYNGAAQSILASDIEHAPDGELQFKGNTDRKGVNGHLHGVNLWDEAFAGIAIVWRRKAVGKKKAKIYIADGHQRLDRAHFLKTTRDGKPIRLNCIVLNEEDGWDAQKVRLFAAYKNIAEDGPTTSAFDVAHLLRMSEQPVDVNFLRRWLPTKNRALSDGLWLSRLGKEAFNLICRPGAKPVWGSYIAQRLPIHGDAETREQTAEMQEVLAQTLLESKPTSDYEMAQIVDMAIEAGFTKVEQMTLFGKESVKETLIPQRIRIYREADQLLRKRQEAIRIVDRDTHTRVTLKVGAQKAAMMEAADTYTWSSLLLRREANVKGEVSTQLTTHARRLKNGETTVSEAAEHMINVLAANAAEFRTRSPGAATEEATKRNVARTHGVEAMAALAPPSRDLLEGVNTSAADAAAAPSLFT